MAPRAAPIPDPVLDSDGDVAMFAPEITAALEKQSAGLGGCVVCTGSTIWCWPLWKVARAIEHEPDRVVDTTAGPYTYRRVAPDSWPASAALHPGCVSGVLDAWAWTVHGDSVLERDDLAAAAVTRPAAGAARRQGAYGRRASR